METTGVILCFDGACEPRNPGGWATYGYVIRQNGQVLTQGKGCVGHGCGMTNNVAEYAGLIAGLQQVLDLNQAGPIEVRGDSQLVINQVSGRWACRAANLQPFRQQALDLARQIGDVAWRWVPREQNTEADALSKQAYHEARWKHTLQLTR